MSTVYEQFVQDVYQSLVDQDAVKTIGVRHNVVLTGKSGATHQIDVFWEFELAGQQYRTCVECKHYSSDIKKSHVASFATILDDIGNANGIFVTTEGYQKGAKLLARQRNIRLILLNPTIRAVEMEMVLQVPHVSNFKFEFNAEAARVMLAATGLKTFTFTGTGETAVLREEATGELHDLTKALGALPTEGPARVDLSKYTFKTQIGWIPLVAATFDVKFSEIRESFSIEAEDAVKAIVEDVLANTKHYVNSDGRLIAVPSDQNI